MRPPLTHSPNGIYVVVYRIGLRCCALWECSDLANWFVNETTERVSLATSSIFPNLWPRTEPGWKYRRDVALSRAERERGQLPCETLEAQASRVVDDHLQGRRRGASTRANVRTWTVLAFAWYLKLSDFDAVTNHRRNLGMSPRQIGKPQEPMTRNWSQYANVRPSKHVSGQPELVDASGD